MEEQIDKALFLLEEVLSIAKEVQQKLEPLASVSLSYPIPDEEKDKVLDALESLYNYADEHVISFSDMHG